MPPENPEEGQHFCGQGKREAREGDFKMRDRRTRGEWHQRNQEKEE